MRKCSLLATIAALSAALPAGACSKMTDKVVGEASQFELKIDFGKCSETDCDTEVVAQPLEPTPAQGCDNAHTRTVTPDWVEHYWDLEMPCDVGQCVPQRLQMAAAPDGSLWISASLTTEQWDNNVGGVYLAGYAADGTLFHESLVDFEVADRDVEVEYETQIAADTSGRIVLLVNKSIGEIEGDKDAECALFEFDSDGSSMGKPVILSDATAREIAFDAEDNLYILGYQDDHYEELSLAKVNADSQLLWVQNSVSGPNNHTNVDAFTVAPDGTVTIRGFRQGLIASEDGIVISHFDSDGSILWERKPTSMDPSWINNEGLGADSKSNILRVSYLDTGLTDSETGEAQPQPEIVPRFRLEKLSSGGEALWAVEQPLHLDAEGFARAPNICNPVADANGNMYVGSADILEDGDEHLVIRHVAADGSDCGVIVVDEEELFTIETLALGPNGKLYFSGQHGFGVLDL